VPSVRQYDADGTLVRAHEVTLASSLDTVQVRIGADRIRLRLRHGGRDSSDPYVTLADTELYTATDGQHEFIRHYPVRTRALRAMLGTSWPFADGRFPRSRAASMPRWAQAPPRLLMINLSNVKSRIRVGFLGNRPCTGKLRGPDHRRTADSLRAGG